MSKYVVGVSLGSSSRNHSVDINVLGESIRLERIGTDGDMQKAMDMIKSLDGKADAIGLGGIDLYIYAGNRKYTFRDSQRLAKMASITPIVDGGGLKHSLERRVIKSLDEEGIFTLAGKRVLLVCAVDRPGMAETFVKLDSDVVFGDLVFALGIPGVVRSLKTIDYLARALMPVLSRLPFRYVYPTGNKQTQKPSAKHQRLYDWAEVIAGDFHFIRKFLPETLKDKVVITNTVTSSDVELLKERGLHMLVTTTPELGGRSFGTNVIEAMLVALIGKPPHLITSEDYFDVMDRAGFKPRIEYLD